MSSNIFVKLDAQLAKEGYPRKKRQDMMLEFLVYLDAIYVKYMYTDSGRSIADHFFKLLPEAAHHAGLIMKDEISFPYLITKRQSYKGTHWRADDV